MINVEGNSKFIRKSVGCKKIVFISFNLGYTDLHRATLQTMSGYGTVEENELKTIFESIWKNCKV